MVEFDFANLLKATGACLICYTLILALSEISFGMFMMREVSLLRRPTAELLFSSRFEYLNECLWVLPPLPDTLNDNREFCAIFCAELNPSSLPLALK